MAKPALTISPNPADPTVIRTLALIRRLSLAAVILIASAILTGWLIPAAGRHLPSSFEFTKANTALCVLLIALSLRAMQRKISRRAVLLVRAASIIVVLITSAILFQYLFHRNIGIDTLLSADVHSPTPGRMSAQSAIALLMLAVITLLIRARKSILSHCVDILTIGQGLYLVVLTSGYLFGAARLFGSSMQNRVGPMTLFCLFCLTIVVFNERTQFGAFSIFVGDSIAGKTVRVAAPFALGLPFLLEGVRATVVKFSLLQPEYATALGTSTIALLAFCLIFVMVRRIQALERNIRDLSLRDELTGLNNRRGFYVLAAQALRLAQRSRTPFSVLFFDMDNLKYVNDTFGHESGSELLQEMAAILSTNFREVDVIGRLGGDEFAVAGNAGPADIAIVLKRLTAATSRANDIPLRSFPIDFSYGHVTTNVLERQTLDELLDSADRIMYAAKREKRRSAESSISRPAIS